MPVTASPVVLVVEDDPHVLELLADLLREEGYAVLEARDGREAISVLDETIRRSARACIVLLDLMLPHVDGLDVLHHVAEHHDHVPVVAMSASGEHLTAARRQGARDILPKPFDLDKVLAVVAAHCPPVA